jgi:hypothetical protein
MTAKKKQPAKKKSTTVYQYLVQYKRNSENGTHQEFVNSPHAAAAWQPFEDKGCKCVGITYLGVYNE